MVVDPRILTIPKKLALFKHIVPILSPKGGVGKTTIAVALAGVLSENIRTVSLLDLDINNPTAHIVLGVDVSSATISEEKGVLPLKLLDDKLEFMSIALFTRDRLLPLRGKSISNVIIEILSITRWSGEVLIVDMPPGFSDEVMDIIRLCPRVRALLISGADRLSLLSIKRAVEVLNVEGVEIIGVVGNMCKSSNDIEMLSKSCKSMGIELLTCIPWIENLDRIYGDIVNLKTLLKPYLQPMLNRLV